MNKDKSLAISEIICYNIKAIQQIHMRAINAGGAVIDGDRRVQQAEEKN